MPLNWNIIKFLLLAFSLVFSCNASATTYSATSTPYNWINSSTHTKLGPTTGGVYSSLYAFTNPGGSNACGTSPPDIDDAITVAIPLGFTFKFGTLPYTSVYIDANGRVQFANNTACGYGSQSVGVPYWPYPESLLNSSIRIFGADLDPSMTSEVSGLGGSCTSRTTCYVSYASIGTAPNQQFVVTWVNVPEWGSNNDPTGYYNLQLILNSDGSFIFQYGASVEGPGGGNAQIGYELTTTDYLVYSTGLPAANSAIKFFIPNNGVVVAPGKFNAFDTDTFSGATSGVIQTKTAGATFTLDVVALNSPPSVLTNFTGSVKVELVDATTGGGVCSAMTSIQTIASSYTYVSADQGRHTFSGITQNNAYSDVMVRISNPATSPSTVVCGTDPFAIRPSTFVLTAQDQNWTTAGTVNTLTNVNTSGAPIHKAGQPLTLTVTPYNSLGTAGADITSNYNGAPTTASVTCVQPPPASCVAGTFSTGSYTNNSGVMTSTTASYTDVGVISLTISDSTFTNVDSADGTPTSQLTITSTPLSIGRFVPDHFDVTLNTPQFTPACVTKVNSVITDGFTYLGQPITYAINPVATVTARNAAGGAAQNYTIASGLNKISPSNGTYGISPSYAEASQAVTVLNAAVPGVADLGGGASTLTFADTSSSILGITRPANPINAYGVNIAMSFKVWDTDDVTVANVNGVAAANPVQFGAASSGNGIAFTGGFNTMGWGRLAMSNADGTELSALTVPMVTQYYVGNTFITNSHDNCTAISLANQISLSNPSTANGAGQAGTATMTVGGGTSTASLQTALMVAGSNGIVFASPGAGNTGYINIASNISASLSWLLYPWNQGGTGNTSPSAVATFGIYQGNPNVIFFKEVY